MSMHACVRMAMKEGTPSVLRRSTSPLLENKPCRRRRRCRGLRGKPAHNTFVLVTAKCLWSRVHSYAPPPGSFCNWRCKLCMSNCGIHLAQETISSNSCIVQVLIDVFATAGSLKQTRLSQVPFRNLRQAAAIQIWIPKIGMVSLGRETIHFLIA